MRDTDALASLREQTAGEEERKHGEATAKTQPRKEGGINQDGSCESGEE